MEIQTKNVGIREIADGKLYMIAEGKADNTIRNYTCNQALFMKYLKEKSVEKLQEVTPEIINQYRIYLSLKRPDRGRLAIRTQNERMTAVMYLFRFLVREKHYLYDPTSHIKYAYDPN